MRYLIRKRKRIKVALVGIMLIVALLWIYDYISIHNEPGDLVSDIPISDSGIMRDVSLNLHFLNNGYVFSKLKLGDMDLNGAKIRGDIFLKGKFMNDGFSGKLFSKNITVNETSFRTVAMCFKMLEDELKIDSFRIGSSYELKGRVSLIEPYETKLRFEVKRADIKDMAILARAKDPGVAFGMMNGIFYIEGMLANLLSYGFIESKNGKVGPVEYDFANIRVEGFGPILNIVDSTFKQGDGSLMLGGYIDVRNLARGDALDGLKFRTDRMPFVWNGWDISSRGKDEVRMTKDINEKMRIGFKTEARKDVTSYYDKENPEEMSLEYKVGIENLKMKLKDNEEFFGIEHKVEF